MTPTKALEAVDRFLAKARTLAGAAVTWLLLASTVLTLAVAELGEQLGTDHPAVVLGARVVVWLGTAVAIVRRVTPVPPSDRGL
jgi:hypothetical protein